MMKKLLIVLTFFCCQNFSFAQVFDGFGISTIHIGYGLGDNNYANLSSDFGWNDYISSGVGFKYYHAIETTSIGTFERTFGFGAEGRLNVHASNMFNLGKSDILAGYHYKLGGTHGIHGAYHYYLTDVIGVNAKAQYVVARAQDYFEESNFNIEFGILFSFETSLNRGRRTF